MLKLEDHNLCKIKIEFHQKRRVRKNSFQDDDIKQMVTEICHFIIKNKQKIKFKSNNSHKNINITIDDKKDICVFYNDETDVLIL